MAFARNAQTTPAATRVAASVRCRFQFKAGSSGRIGISILDGSKEPAAVNRA
jgi:hypothetical protein